MTKIENSSKEMIVDAPMIFVSDVHMGAFPEKKETEVEQDLISLIDYAEANGFKINILGDLFDYWMEYTNHHPRIGTNVLQRFSSLNNYQPSLYITGNHDNWVDHHFSDLGFDVESEYRILKTNGKRILLLHGDGVKDKNIELQRPLFHRFLRNSYFVFLYKHIFHPSLGIWLMKWFARFSRSTFRGEEDVCTVPIDTWAEKMMSQQRFDVIICGHHHYPRYKNINHGLYINLGNFFNKRTIAIYNNGKFELVKWNGPSKKIERLFPH